MTDAQLKAKRMLKQHHSYLTHQQIKTLNGLIKSGDIVGAMNVLHTIMARHYNKRRV
jgi:Fe2+ or Zn2+ uptake regulation protein